MEINLHNVSFKRRPPLYLFNIPNSQADKKIHHNHWHDENKDDVEHSQPAKMWNDRVIIWVGFVWSKQVREVNFSKDHSENFQGSSGDFLEGDKEVLKDNLHIDLSEILHLYFKHGASDKS